MTDLLRNRPFPLTAGGILIGIALMATRSLPLAVIGVGIIVAGLLVPFAQLQGQHRDEQHPSVAHPPRESARERQRASSSAIPARRRRIRRVPLSPHEQSEPEQAAFP